uniref:L1 transposable element RRM domain-containing protein n=1 Tax=Sus scrofa TaxID=9823 RepID=A0A8D0NV23_PIG
MRRNVYKGIEDLKIQQAEMINTIAKIKNSLEGNNNKKQEAEEQKSNMEDRLVEITDVEWNEEKRIKRIEDSLKELWDNFKHTNVHIIGVPEGEERDKGPEKISEEIIAENFPNMGKESFTQIQEAQQIPYRINPRRNTPRHILIKLTKIKGKEQILKASREKQQITYKGSPVRLSADFSTETLQARREWHDIFKVTKGKKPATKNPLPSKTFFQI